MTNRVEKDSERGPGLVFGFGRSERENGAFGDVEVQYVNVDVGLLGERGIRPRGRDVVIDPLERKGRTVVHKFDPVVVAITVVIADWQTRKRAVERGEGAMVGAVDRQHGKSSNSRHRRNVAIARPHDARVAAASGIGRRKERRLGSSEPAGALFLSSLQRRRETSAPRGMGV